MNQLIELTKSLSNFNEIKNCLLEVNFDHKKKWLHVLQKKHQSWLFENSSAIKTLGDLIPKSTPSLTEVIFEGKNSLPCFNFFQKRMCYSSDQKNIWGYNHQSLQSIVGPGYFGIDSPEEVLMIDYTLSPSEKPHTWPSIKLNKSGLSRLVYFNLKDELRKISDGVFVGLATKNGKSLGQYFTLIRDL